ncbi:serine protease inhibitor Kazal-type 14-like [Delphinapterus leucas]|uniref:Serine protease inhibitor Kazal-type 14-like n=1 Tax=Delphinapterus leucas TaxID=9749 RepID=A0A2Y9PK24_DELLE|nr:serine protease inhibitor Kazal-type 14-like [Delphinapterus leucas]
MAKSFPVLCSLLFFIVIHLTLPSVSGPPHWRPPHGNIKFSLQNQGVTLNDLMFYNFKIRVSLEIFLVESRLSWFNGTVNPCPGIYQPICGNNLITYENPCILCVESMKSQGKIRFLHDGKC